MTRTIDLHIQQTAAQWFAQLQDCEVTVDEMLAWQRWMRADARHAAAFAGIEETWEVLSETSADRIEKLSAVVPAARRRVLPIAALAAGLATLAIGAGGWLWVNRATATFETAVAENRTLRLADGSEVALGGDSRLQIRLTGDSRRLKLLRGEALFTVAKDPARPFTVHSGEATITAVGTAFNVRRNDDRTVVAVVEGRVLVETQQARAPNAVQLDAGERTIIRRNAQPAVVGNENPAATIAWRSGLLSFQREPLRYVIQDVNRYASKPIVLGDEAIGELRITGTVMNDNVAEWIGSLESAFGLQATQEPQRIVLHSSKTRR